MTPEVQVAVEEIHNSFAGHEIEVEPEDQGGAYVIVHDLPIGEQYEPSISWIGFLIAFQYPSADVYPHFLNEQICRKDGRPLGSGFSGPTQWRGRQVVQVSRRSHRWNPVLDTAELKLAKVLQWVRSQ